MQKDRVYHVGIFVPPQYVDAVLDAICQVTPLSYGPYVKSAWWSAVGTEQFEPMPGAKPTVGTIGQTERVETVRLEFMIPADPELLEQVMSEGVFKSHPWQTPAIFVNEAMALFRELDK